jgi:hypothetical protein
LQPDSTQHPASAPSRVSSTQLWQQISTLQHAKVEVKSNRKTAFAAESSAQLK